MNSIGQTVFQTNRRMDRQTFGHINLIGKKVEAHYLRPYMLHLGYMRVKDQLILMFLRTALILKKNNLKNKLIMSKGNPLDKE